MKYENPICEIVELKSLDVITTSDGTTNDGGDTHGTNWDPANVNG